jgi:hypothetical protein
VEKGDLIPGSDEYAVQFRGGLTFMVPEGEGKITLDLKTEPRFRLMLMIGPSEPFEIEKTRRGEVTFNYNVKKPTYCCLNLAEKEEANARGTRSGERDKHHGMIYSIKVVAKETSPNPLESISEFPESQIETVETGTPEPEPEPITPDPDPDPEPEPVTPEPEPTHQVIVAKVTGGNVESTAVEAKEGQQVNLRVTPDEGYEPKTPTVKDQNGSDVYVGYIVDPEAGPLYWFLMPGSNVIVDCAFEKIIPDTPDTPDTPDIPDIPDGIYSVNSDKATTDEWLDLQGRRIAPPTKKGLYIRNGKKTIIR